MQIPKIGAQSSLVAVGLQADGSLEVPPVENPGQAAWWSGGPTPGEVGPAVILGHVDGMRKPGVFFRLKELRPGDDVVVARRDGRELHFRVTRTTAVAKNHFPTDEVYGDTAGPELRVITCGGKFDRKAHSYVDNIVVYAALDH